MDLVRHFEKEQMKNTTRPLLAPGDIVRVEMKIKEGDKSRLQIFEGTVLSIRGSGPSATFTVRREAGGFGVERIFPLYSPLITNIEMVKRQKVRRAKLNYLRAAGRRRFKEDVKAMQRHVKEEEAKQRLAAAAAKAVAAKEEKAKKAEAEQKDSPSSETTAKQSKAGEPKKEKAEDKRENKDEPKPDGK